MARVLVADDVKAMRDLLRQILESDGHEVKEVSNGKGVIELLDEESFDLVLLDIGLPDLNGIEVMKQLSDHENIKKVCFVTGEKDQSTVIQAMKAGGSDFIVKPVDILVFREKMARLVGGNNQGVVKIVTDLKVEIPGFPVDVDMRIVELSEVGVQVVSSMSFKEGSSINLVSATVSDLLGEEMVFPCLVQGVAEKKGEGVFLIKCGFVGLHEHGRQQIRKLTVKGEEIRDVEEMEDVDEEVG